MTEPPRKGLPAWSVWRTLRFRFALMTAALLLLTLAGFGAFVYTAMSYGLSASVDEALRLNAAQALTALDVEAGRLELPDSFLAGPQTAALGRRGFVLRILDADGHLLRDFGAYQDLPVPQESITAARSGDAALVTLTDPVTRDAVRLYTVPIIVDGRTAGIYQVGQSLADVRDTLSRLLQALAVGGLGVTLAAGFGAYLLAAGALAPIDRITRTARRISAQDLSARLDLPPTDDEMGRLAATLNEMLARLEDAFAREQRFTADASHELRTPLAAMQTILDVTRERRRTPDEYARALDDLAEETERLARLTASLLFLARSNGQDAFTPQPVDLSTLLADLCDSLRPLAERKGLVLACHLQGGLLVLGSADGLIRVFANLVDNAIKYTGQGHITIQAREGPGGQVEVLLADTGVGIPPEHLPRVFERFYRVDPSRTSQGAGLGLAIAQQIIHAHGGSIALDSAPGLGTTLTVRLPAAR